MANAAVIQRANAPQPTHHASAGGAVLPRAHHAAGQGRTQEQGIYPAAPRASAELRLDHQLHAAHARQAYGELWGDSSSHVLVIAFV